MVAMAEPDIFDYLAKQTVADTTQANLHDSLKSTNIDRGNTRAWQDALMIAKAFEASRTFSHGLPIYDTGKVVTASLADGASVTHTPDGTEVWLVQVLDPNGCQAAIKDAAGQIALLSIDAGASVTVPPSPIYLTSTQSLFISNGTGSSKDPAFAYIKVSL